MVPKQRGAKVDIWDEGGRKIIRVTSHDGSVITTYTKQEGDLRLVEEKDNE